MADDYMTADGWKIEIKDGKKTYVKGCVGMDAGIILAENRMRRANILRQMIPVTVYGGPILFGQTDRIEVQLPTSSSAVLAMLRSKGIEVWKAYLDFGDDLSLRIV